MVLSASASDLRLCASAILAFTRALLAALTMRPRFAVWVYAADRQGHDLHVRPSISFRWSALLRFWNPFQKLAANLCRHQLIFERKFRFTCYPF